MMLPPPSRNWPEIYDQWTDDQILEHAAVHLPEYEYSAHEARFARFDLVFHNIDPERRDPDPNRKPFEPTELHEEFVSCVVGLPPEAPTAR